MEVCRWACAIVVTERGLVAALRDEQMSRLFRDCRRQRFQALLSYTSRLTSHLLPPAPSRLSTATTSNRTCLSCIVPPVESALHPATAMWAPSHIFEIPRPRVCTDTCYLKATNRKLTLFFCRLFSRKCLFAPAPKSSPSSRS